MTDISGQKYFPLLSKSGQIGLFSKMCLATSLWASTKCYLTWQTKPIIKSKHFILELAVSMPRTDVCEFGLWATPDANSANRGGTLKRGKRPSGAKRRVSINDQVKMWPTPRACTAMSAPNIHNRINDKNPNLEAVVAQSMVVSKPSGSLNPTWVEWLMGYPDGWTDLEG